MIYHTRTRRHRQRRNYVADAVNWIVVLLLIAFITLLLASPLLKPL